MVTGNCNVGGIVEGLHAVMPGVAVRGFPAWELETEEARRTAAEAVDGSDAWVRMPIPENTGIAAQSDALRVIDLPNLVFSAFHPDAVYAVRRDGSIFRGITDYHSAIGLWAWRRGLSPSEAGRLFSPEVMHVLTYDRYWEPSVAAMKADFLQSSLAFPTFWMRLKRSGVFMHTINHPTASTLSLLAKAIAVRLGAAEDVWDIPAERYVQDFLSHIVWPVYPWIGERLGIPGCFQWKMDGWTFDGVEEWLEETFAVYGDTPRDDVLSHRLEDGVYDRVLGAAVDAFGIRTHL